MSALILFSTVVSSFGLGIAVSYGSVVAVLHAFGNQRRVSAPVQRKVAVPVLIAQESQASGD